MSMNEWAIGQVKSGNLEAAEAGRRLAKKYGEIPLPHQSAHPQSHELSPITVARFTPEAREGLTNEGFVIYELTGRSIKTLRDDESRPFCSTWHKNHPKLEATSSRLSEVAFDPAQLLLPNSNKKTLEQQELMVREFSKGLAKKAKIDDVEAIIGEMSDYTDLVFAHFEATGVCLFGKDCGYNYARTITPTVESFVALVGYFRAVDGLDVRSWHRDNGFDHVFASPLVVPASPIGWPKAA